AVFPQKALNALDSNSGPTFTMPNDPACYSRILTAPQAAAGAVTDDAESGPPPVTVYIRAEVGPFDVAVVGSSSPTELVNWLHGAGYRITPAMEPYVARYTEEGMKFLALKLQDTADVKDLKPFRFTLPGTAPSIPLRMTALAAEPEMGIVVFVLGQQRYEGKNWANIAIADDQIKFNPFSYNFSVSTNWTQLVAKGVDEAGGQGWVTEFAGPSASYAQQIAAQVQNDNFATQEDREAAQALLTSLQAYPYLTRLYTRVSAEEMTSDPVFGRSVEGDVSTNHQLSRYVDGVDQCPMDPKISTDPCDFATCGAAGLCRPVPVANTGMPAVTNGSVDPSAPVAGCACWAGATARLTYAPDGSTTVVCQDGRLSFLNPGDSDQQGGGEVLPDPCAGFSCGSNGQCIAMNLTPTCVCDQGYVAVGQIASDGTRKMNCVKPAEAVPATFYANTLPALPDELPGGREVKLTEPAPMPMPGTTPEPVGGANFPMPRSNPDLGPSQVPVGGDSPPCCKENAKSGGCDIAPPAPSSAAWGWLAALGVAASLRRRRGR
ncbi:MAG TPA: DUF2330 domain-containing protein, partial [Polyangiaceae bacterium]|nr:DUF2330 domain-containing protein [Polyangiaceae bacterium]